MDEKLTRYWTLSSVYHCLAVDPQRRADTHHRRGGNDGTIQTRVHQGGTLALEPPGTAL